MNRVDAVLDELSSRHQNTDARFLAAIRPIVERILAPDTPASARVGLMELLAETFERDVQIRQDIAAARQGIVDFFDTLRRLIDPR